MCGIFKNKKGSSLTMFLFACFDNCLQILHQHKKKKKEKRKKGQRNNENESKEKALFGMHTSLSAPVAQKAWPGGGITCHCSKGALCVDV